MCKGDADEEMLGLGEHNAIMFLCSHASLVLFSHSFPHTHFHASFSVIRLHKIH